MTKVKINAEKIKLGDLVYLKSGSPKMTVATIDEAEVLYKCFYWSDTTSEFKEIVLHIDMINKFED